MAQYDEHLNKDTASVKTSARYDSDVGGWINDVANYVHKSGIWVPWDGEVGVSNSIDLRGLATNKPAASTVNIGTTFWSIDTGEIEVSDGTNWLEV